MFSFKINKTTALKNTIKKNAHSSTKAFHEEDENDEEPDFIDGLDGTNIVSKKQEKPKKKELLVIPLITKNEWRVDARATESGGTSTGMGKVVGAAASNTSVDNSVDSENPGVNNGTNSLRDQAIQELLTGGSSTTSGQGNKSKAIPLLFQNKIPEGYEEEDNMDVSLRPEQSSLEDYDRVPIEEFGLAMLRGMGWKETEGIGSKNKKVVEMSEPKLRPKGMGLGAEIAHASKIVPQASATGNGEKEDLSFKIGGFAVITKGSKRGYYGQIESFDEDNNHVILRLSISGKMEAVSKFCINIVSQQEFKKSSKVINSEKYEEFKTRQDRHREEDEPIREESESPRRNRGRASRSRSNSRSDSEEREYKKKSHRGRSPHEETHSRSDKRRREYQDHVSEYRHRDRSRERRDDRNRSDAKRYEYDRRYKSDNYHKKSGRNNDRNKASDRHRRSDDRRDRRHRHSSTDSRD